MSALLSKLKKNTTSKFTDVLPNSEIYNGTEQIPTSIPLLNIALSGDLDVGFKPGIIGISGPSRHFKTGYLLQMAAAFQRKYADGVILFLDSEFGSPATYFEASGVDVNRVVHVPVTNLEEMTFELMQQIDGLARNDHVMIAIDSIGNVASKKEVENALESKGTKDMTRAQVMKSMFRQVTPLARMKNIPIVFINHIYMEMGNYPKAIMSGGQGPMLAADTIFIIGRSQEKDGTELEGYTFTINVEKSRFVKEKSKIPITVTFEGGLNRWSGLLDLAKELKFAGSPSMGWYQMIDQATGEYVGPKVRKAQTETDEFLGVLLKDDKFKQAVRERFQLTTPKPLTTDLSELDEV